MTVHVHTLIPALIGASAAIEALRRLIAKLGPARHLAISIEGPTGAGKELVARALHAASGRGGAFMAFNVCALADTMFEDALFGHVKGAFTGAVRDSAGYLAEANGGTLFLDEISGLPAGAQAKLLRALETREYRPVGARYDRRSDFRLVTATNESLAELVGEGRFRADLLYRMRGAVVRVPALRERLDDVPALARHFAERVACEYGGAPVTLSSGALRALQAHDWPGNVRELRQVVERAAALAECRTLGASEIADALSHGGVTARVGSAPDRQVERREMLGLMERVGWNTATAAEQLGVNRVTVYRRLERLGISLPRTYGARDTTPAPPSGEQESAVVA